MQSPPISRAEIEKRIAGHLDELVQLWWAEQGTTKPRDLDLIASAIPFPRDKAIRVLDLCCGPGDAGRAILKTYPNAEIDAIDRDPFLTAICAGVNRREGVRGKVVVRDLEGAGWESDLPGKYDVIAMVNALHWFDAKRAAELLYEVHAKLNSGGVFLLAEPAVPEPPFAAGFEEWKDRLPQRYSRAAWERFWFRANEILGYDHIKLLGSRDDERLDDLATAAWRGMLDVAGFGLIDVLWRDADQVIFAARGR